MIGARRLYAGALFVSLAAGVACADLRPLHGTVYDPPPPAPAARLVRGDGSVFDLAAERGRVVALFFGYANCPDVCPTTLAELARVTHALDAEERQRFQVVFVSVDPARDTPALAAAYARRFHPSFVGVTGPAAAVASTARAFGVAATPMPPEARDAPASSPDAHRDHGPAAAPPAGYDVMHAGSVFLVDPAGRLRTVLPNGTRTADVVADVRKLMD